MSPLHFPTIFKALTGNTPFPWQIALYKKLIEGDIPSSANIPTGLGKTSIVTIWLIALAQRFESVPRRLIYVVNRRTVVDQTTAEVEKLRDALSKPELAEVRNALASLCALPLPKPDSPPLAISTLRGQFADNGEWCTDPARPAVVIGTVDMIGSGLLFSRYTAGFKLRPLYAALLAQDALLVHDEAHLEPAFQNLLEAVVTEQARDKDPRKLRVIALTATSRMINQSDQLPFGLTEEDKKNHIEDGIERNAVLQRFQATKQLCLAGVAADSDVCPEIIRLSLQKKDTSRSVLIFVRSVVAAEKIAAEFSKHKSIGPKHVAILTGTLRGKERDELVSCDAVFQRFLPSSSRSKNVTPAEGTVYLIATSAGEVGVNLSASDLICDLSTFESMTQRFGRVNRFGENQTSTIAVVHAEDIQEKYDEGLKKAQSAQKDAAKKVKTYEENNRMTVSLLRTLQLLRHLATHNAGVGDASPAALDALNVNDRAAAFSPLPEMRVATDILFNVWALTSIRGPLATRPPVAPYLHGEAEWEPPETHVAWRDETECVVGNSLDAYPPEELLEDFPLKPRELLRDISGRVFDRLVEIASGQARSELNKLNGWLVLEEGKVEIFPLKNLLADDTGDPSEDDSESEDAEGNDTSNDAKAATKRRKDRIVAHIANRLLILPPSFGGLSRQGFLAATDTTNAISREMLDVSTDSPTNERIRDWSDTPEIPAVLRKDFRLARIIDTQLNKEDSFSTESDSGVLHNARSNATSSRARYWLWLETKRTTGFEHRYSSNTEPETLAAHTTAVVGHARALADKLLSAHASSGAGGDPDLGRCLVLAAQCHDLGKRRLQWQRSIGNINFDPKNHKTILAKSGGKLRPRLLAEHYRHEFGSLSDISTTNAYKDAEIHEEFSSLSELERDIILHLIAAHHGRARPHFPEDEIFDYLSCSPHQSTCLATEIPRRFARLQRHFGKWGLAWIETLLRVADYAASSGIIPANGTAKAVFSKAISEATNAVSANKLAQPPAAIFLHLNPTNPGHYFACCGLFELAATLEPDARAWFSDNGGTFHISHTGFSLKDLLKQITSAEIAALNEEDATASPLLIGAPFSLRLDWWKCATRETAALKVWAGTMECPRIARSMQAAIRAAMDTASFVLERILLDTRIAYDPQNPDNKVEPFYFDANRGPNAHSRDVGFATNDLKMETLAAPAVELFTLVGFQRATPAPVSNLPRNFDYSLWKYPLSVSLLPAAVNGLLPDSSRDTFRFESWFRTGQRKHKAFLTARAISSR